MNLHVPAEAMPPRRRSRFLDWRFLTALTALVLTVLLAVGAAQLLSQLRSRDHQITGLQTQVSRLDDRIAALTDRGSDERRAAARAQARLLRQQAFMIRLLQAHGIATPARVTVPQATATPAAPRSPASHPAHHHATGGHAAHGTHPAKRHPKHHPKPTPQPAPQPSPTPDPGKSGPIGGLLGGLLRDLPL